MTVRLQATGLEIPNRLARCDVALEGGCVTMIVGPNGAGKTSLLRALAGIEGRSDEILVDRAALGRLPPVRRTKKLAFLGASRAAKWPLFARDFIGLAFSGARDDGRIDEVLASLEAAHLGPRRLDRLSTGERSRIMIARALATGAGVALLDEPCANLDPKWQIAILERLRTEAVAGSAVALSIHDLDLARQFGDRVLVVADGAIVADGAPAEALSDDRVERVFGVKREGSRWVRA